MKKEENAVVSNVDQLVTEVDRFGHKLGYIKKQNSVTNLNSIEIEKVIAEIDASLNSMSFFNMAIIPTTFILSFITGILIAALDELTITERLIAGTSVGVFCGVLLLLSLGLKELSYQRNYLKNILIMYVKYK